MLLLVLIYFVSASSFVQSDKWTSGLFTAVQDEAPLRTHHVRSLRRAMVTSKAELSYYADHNSPGVRLNKCIPSLSRRAADAVIQQGKVTVNSQTARRGTKVRFADVVRYEGKVQYWQTLVAAKTEDFTIDGSCKHFLYLKYWKPYGVTCTADKSDRSNIVSVGKFDLLPQRVFTVGRLDRESSGLILLTSDGRVSNAMLSKRCQKEKTYMVEMDTIPSEEQINQLSSGVEITTPTRKNKNGEELEYTAKTLPCTINRPNEKIPHVLEFTLIEGRNRQIRRMAQAVGLEVLNLHRTSFGDITLAGLKEGEWAELTAQEMQLIQVALNSDHAPPPVGEMDAG